MTQVASVNYDLKRVYLHADTVTNGFDVIAAHFEIKALREANLNGEQNRKHFLSAEGKFKKNLSGTKFTPRFGLLDVGWRFVPYGLVSHQLSLLVEIISVDSLSDRELFDRSTLTVNVDIDAIYKENEITVVAVGSGVTAQDKIDIIQGTKSAIFNAESN